MDSVSVEVKMRVFGGMKVLGRFEEVVGAS